VNGPRVPGAPSGGQVVPWGQQWPRAQGRPAAPPTPAPAAPALPREPALGFKQHLVYFTWVLTLFAPQWIIGGPTRQLQSLITVLSLVIIAVNTPRRGWNGPLLAFWAVNLLTMPFAVNRFYATYPVKMLLVFYTFSIITISYIRTPREAWPLIAMMFFWQWIWWIGWGLVPGQVPWHPDLANHDSFGPLMVIGSGICLYFGMAMRKGWMRRVAILLALLCVGGVVSAFARGAVITLALVMVLAWIRSPKKGRMTIAILLMSGTVVVAAEMLGSTYRSGDVQAGPTSFWAEMATSIKGTSEGTGSDRKVLWDLAWKLYLKRPVFGVGGSNFGPASATQLRASDIGGDYAANQYTLYDRALHNTFLQVLCENGTVGAIIFIWMLVDFRRRNAALQRPQLANPWSQAMRGAVDLRMLALGLESGMVGYLGTAFFYNQLSSPWLYALLTTNLLLHVLATRTAKAAAAQPATMPARQSTPPRPVPLTAFAR
jgi:hypothetical protein